MVRRTRSGIVLLIVLVVIVLLALAAYTFTSLMIVEAEAVQFDGQQAQARFVAESGIEYVKSRASVRDAAGRLVASEDFHDVVVRSADGAIAGRFSVLGAADDLRPGPGVTNLSARLNLNLLAILDPLTGREALLKLPEMSPEVADAILDWIDADDEPRDFGAETGYYSTLVPAYGCANAPLRCIDELLRVRGVTPAALYGRKSPSTGAQHAEDDGRGTTEVEGGRGATHGWSSWLTAASNESNLRKDGRPRINLNAPDLEQLFDALEQEFGTDIARFVVAYRIHGPQLSSQPGSQPDPQHEPNVPPSSTAAQPPSFSMAHTAQSRGGLLTFHIQDQPPAAQERGGLILNAGPRHSVRSLFDLIDVQVPQIDASGRLIASPWSADPDHVREYFAEVADALCSTDRPTIAGRINVLQAAEPVLAGVPQMTAELAARIASRQSTVASDHALTLAWLLTENVVPLDELRPIAPFLTVGGDVFSGRVIGRTESVRRACCLEFVLDATGPTPRVNFLRGDVGWGSSSGPDDPL